MVNPVWTGEEIAQQLRLSGATRLVSTAELYVQKLKEAADRSEIVESYLIGQAGPEIWGAMPFEALCVVGAGKRPRVDIRPTDVAFLPFSSGTTGLPKGVVLSRRSLVANLCQMRACHRLSQKDSVIAALPLFHIYGLQVTLNLALLQGATVVILPRFELGAFLRAVQDHRVTRAEVVPPIVLALANSDLVDEYDLSTLQVLTAGAAPLGADLARNCAERIGCRVRQGYGMTELGGATHIAPDHGPQKPDSIGPALPGVECRVVDPDTGADLGPGEAGELLVRSPSAMVGYLDDAAATAATIDDDGWLHTGDIVTVDADSWYRVVDRIKELIKVKGFQVAPAELEDLLLTHPAVADAAVVRSPDEAAGEVPKAFVVLRSPATADELLAWVAARVAPYKRVRGVEFVERIPKSPSGKILRRQLVASERDSRLDDLTGKVILISGGGRGLGRLLAGSLARAGAAIAILARSSDELSATVDEIEAAGGRAAAAIVDVSRPRTLTGALRHFHHRLGRIDVLINNAGIWGPVGPTWEVDGTEWWRTFEINVAGAFALTSAVLPEMIAAGQGRIVNITSNAGVYRWPLCSAYAASKSALIKLTESLAAETRAHGVSVFSVDPGLLPIGMTGVPLQAQVNPRSGEGSVFDWLRHRLASGHGADPDQAARLIQALAAGRADRLSGRHIRIADDLDAMLGRIEQIERDDLHTLRLRDSAAS